jgi:ubiquinone/menaquinone biosynthesis C-methylase UbiE
LTERTREEFTRQAETLESAAVFTDEAVFDRISAALAPMSGMRILDLGCGPGIVSAGLAPDAAEVVAFDLTPEMLRRARARADRADLKNVRLAMGNGDALPFETDGFDRVVTRAAIHHCPDVPGVLAEVARVTRTGGRLVIADVVSSQDEDECEIHNAIETLRDPSHVRMWPRSELLSAVRESGFQVVDESGWNQELGFDEWIDIVNAPERAEPLRSIMTSLGRAGIHAGIELQPDGKTVAFVHHWLLVVAAKT